MMQSQRRQQNKKKKKTNWQHLLENPAAMARYKIWRRQYNLKRKQKVAKHTHIPATNYRTHHEALQNTAIRSRRLSGIETRLDKLEKELGINE